VDKEFEKCVEKGKLAKFSRGRSITDKKISEAFSDMNEAQEGFKNKKFKWATIQSYYAMFNAGNALLMHKGYREKNSHYCLIIGVKELYAKPGLVDISFIEALQKGKALRESASYQGEWSEESCANLLSDAEKFLNKAREIINEKK
jgi:uncharacterized protein (UPF0332 family)